MHASPLGELLLVSEETALIGLHIVRGKYVPAVRPDWERPHKHAILRQAQDELDAYFGGQGQAFSVALAPQGTPFQIRAWAALLTIPFGQTRSYGQQARAIGQPAAARAVGAANGKNPIAIIVPCHRVIGANGAMVGFGGGLDAKRYLLHLEATSHAVANVSVPPPSRHTAASAKGQIRLL
jgi:methylated-DNA-[protein]-cysteine S-methyltransferase